MAASPATGATTFTVLNNSDSDPGSLRDRVNSASAGDTIVIPATISTITLSTQIPVTKSLTIQGAGASTTTVSGNDSTRVFCVQSPDCTTLSGAQPSLSLSGMTITDGKFTLATSTTAVGGGGIFVNGGNLTLDDVAVTASNVTITTSGGVAGGGGIYTNGGALTATNSHIDNNTLNIPNIGTVDGGGGLYSNGSVVSLTNSTIDDNTATLGASNIATAGGGGLFQNGGPVTLTSSHVDDNTLTLNETFGASNYGGGGVYTNGGSVTLTGSTASANSADLTFTGAGGATSEGGGAIYSNGGAVSLTSSTLASNSLTLSVQVTLNASGGGAVFTNGGAWTVAGSTLSDNSADLTHGSAPGSNQNGGGAVFNQGGGAPSLTNSTLTQNTLTVTGAGTNQGGGAILTGGGLGTVTNLTIAGNTASNTVAGGIFAQGGNLRVKDTILANTAPSGSNCVAAAGTLTTLGNNLESANTCGLGAGELRNTNPLLGALGNNGGPTQTEALLAGSPAIDAGAGCPATDQRGVSRPQGPACDIGAFEGGSPATVAAVAVATIPQCGDGRDNDGDGAIDLQDPGCRSGKDPNEGDETLSDLVLCGRRNISLVRADARGRRVVLSGLVAQSLAGKTVRILANYGAKKARSGRLTRLATVKSKSNGTFTARVKRPPARFLNRARFQAQVQRSRSVALKLPQSLATSSVRKKAQTIEVRGKVKRNLLGKRNAVVVRRLVCGRYQTVGSAKPNKRGSYTVRFPAPKLGAAALYRAESRVLAKPGSRRYVKQFARAVGITFTS